MTTPKCFTFYSYKGGSGRSTTLVNTALHLIETMQVSEKEPLLIVDADLESAGLTYFFNKQNKFTHYFERSLHTCGILNNPREKLKSPQVENTFGENGNTKTITRDTINYFSECFPGKKLGDIELHVSDDRNLSLIAELFHFRKIGRVLEGDSKEIYEFYIHIIPDLIVSLDRIERDSSRSESDRKASKRAEIEKCLPLHGFADISEYFGCKYGTVKFLGVDVRYHDEQVARNSAFQAINDLARECGKRNYKAILFDSASGSQSTAHILHFASDVLVYCMRPTQQFIQGTRIHLQNYHLSLTNSEKSKKAPSEGEKVKKPVILLPTAVQHIEDDDPLRPLFDDSFEEIVSIAETFEKTVDGTFCSPEKCLGEVSLFRWREQILGVKDIHECSKNVRTASDIYSDATRLPPDALAAYKVYGELAEAIVKNA